MSGNNTILVRSAVLELDRLSDASESMNIAKDDVLAFPQMVHRDYPPTVTAAMVSVVRPFMCKSLEVIHGVLRVLNDRLGLPEGLLEALHTQYQQCSSEARLSRVVPAMPRKASADRPMVGVHSDFGSLVGTFISFSFRVHHYPFRLFCITFWVISK